MSKKFRNKICVYCAVTPSTTADHVFAREFFTQARRDNLPKVPACETCNNAKSRLELYLAAVMPFGARNTDAHELLNSMVPKRLAKNARLHRELTQGAEYAEMEENGVPSTAALSVPFEPEKLHLLFNYVVKGLLFHHWSVLLGKEHAVEVMSATGFGDQFLLNLLGRNCAQRVEGNFGEGTFVYHAAQGIDYPEFTVWRFSIYGGMLLAGDPEVPEERSVSLGAITARKDFLERPSIRKLLE